MHISLYRLCLTVRKLLHITVTNSFLTASENNESVPCNTQKCCMTGDLDWASHEGITFYDHQVSAGFHAVRVYFTGR